MIFHPITKYDKTINSSILLLLTIQLTTQLKLEIPKKARWFGKVVTAPILITANTKELVHILAETIYVRTNTRTPEAIQKILEILTTHVPNVPIIPILRFTRKDGQTLKLPTRTKIPPIHVTGTTKAPTTISTVDAFLPVPSTSTPTRIVTTIPNKRRTTAITGTYRLVFSAKPMTSHVSTILVSPYTLMRIR